MSATIHIWFPLLTKPPKNMFFCPKRGHICQIGKGRETVTRRVWVYREKFNIDFFIPTTSSSSSIQSWTSWLLWGWKRAACAWMRHLSSHCSTTLWLSAHMLSPISEKYQSHSLPLTVWKQLRLRSTFTFQSQPSSLPSSFIRRVTPAPSSRYDAVTPAPSSRYDAGSSEQVFCTWLIREWNFAYLHHIHTRESPSEYSEGQYWSTLMYVVLKFLSSLKFQYQTAGMRKLLVRWCVKEFQYSSSVTVQEYPRPSSMNSRMRQASRGSLDFGS